MPPAENQNEAVGRAAIENLPISKLMMTRLEAAQGDEDKFDPDPAIASLAAAIVALERLIREG